MSGATFLPDQLPTTYKQSAICWSGVKVEASAEKIKKKMKEIIYILLAWDYINFIRFQNIFFPKLIDIYMEKP